MKVQAVIFDMDGLMFDTETISYEAWVQTGKEFGQDFSEEFILSFVGMNLKSLEKKFNASYGEQLDFAEVNKRCYEIYNKILEEQGVPIKPGLMELLAYLKENNYKIALATSAPREGATWNLKKAGVDSYFNTYVCGDMVTKGKPDPEIFLTAAKILGEKPADCMVLEDSIHGITAAILGGFPTVMVPDLLQPERELEERLTAKCDSLLDVILLLESIRTQ